jgi:hypothetical protein
MIVMAAFRRRATAQADRCVPAIIREASYERIEELMAIFRWFGTPEAMTLENPEDYAAVPGLTLAEATALVRFRRRRARRYDTSYYAAAATAPATPPSAPSRDEVILTEALRRRALAMAQRYLPPIIRDAGYEALDELLDIFWSFGSSEAMLLEGAEGPDGRPGRAGLTHAESNALVSFRMKRGECNVGFGGAVAATPPKAATAQAAPSLLEPTGSTNGAEAAPPAAPALAASTVPRSPTTAVPPMPPKSRRRLVFRNSRLWWIDRFTGEIISEARIYDSPLIK